MGTETKDKKIPLKLDNIKKFIIIAGFLGIALILLSSSFGKSENDDKNDVILPEFDMDSYRCELESRLADIISHIDGAGDTGVMITLEGGREYVYAKNTRKESSSDADSIKNSGESEYYTVKSSSNGEEPVLIHEREPCVKGVMIVCSGADNSEVREKITEAVASLFDIPKSNISVNKISPKS